MCPNGEEGKQDSGQEGARLAAASMAGFRGMASL